MPRLPNSLIRQARSKHPYLPLLLRACRTLESAKAELRWLDEAALSWAEANADSTPQHTLPSKSLPRSIKKRGETLIAALKRKRLTQLCIQRGRSVPLQYLLGTEFFGDMELKVKRGVLIPRWETASITAHLAANLHSYLPPLQRVGNVQKPLKVLDLCCGSGCMGLVFTHEVLKQGKARAVELLGVDSSAKAVKLGRENAAFTARQSKPLGRRAKVGFRTADLMSLADLKRLFGREGSEQEWDVIVANPPYVSKDEYWSSNVDRSVRWHEPREALVPHISRRTAEGDKAEDTFYYSIFQVAARLQVRVMVMEVSGKEQAVRIAQWALSSNWTGAEVWRDEPGVAMDDEMVATYGMNLHVRGRGNVRGLIIWHDKEGGQ